MKYRVELSRYSIAAIEVEAYSIDEAMEIALEDAEIEDIEWRDMDTEVRAIQVMEDNNHGR